MDDDIIENFKRSRLLPMDPFVHTSLENNQTVWALKSSLLSPWEKAKVIQTQQDTVTHGDTVQEKVCKVCYDPDGRTSMLPLKHVAYSESSPVHLLVGARVIAPYMGNDEEKDKVVPLYHAGIVAEPLRYLNRYRYLILFDDGYVQYCTHDQVKVVCHSSDRVWLDMDPKAQDFAREYLQRYPEWPNMVRLKKDQTVKVEWKGVWYEGRVEKLDGPLAYIHLISPNRFEWMWRGSSRLWPFHAKLYAAVNNLDESKFSEPADLADWSET